MKMKKKKLYLLIEFIKPLAIVAIDFTLCNSE